jgi:hypothetical protein
MDDEALLQLADTVAAILAEFGSVEELDGLAEQMGRLIAELQPTDSHLPSASV